jgi:RNA polymerase sigma factor (sigma-70 family)
VNGDEAERLVLSAREGDEKAWYQLVAGYERLVFAIAFGFRLRAEDRDDVRQTVFFRLAQSLNTIREPAKVGGWIATTARHECLALVRRRRPELSLDPDEELSDDWTPEDKVLADERAAGLWAAFERLDQRCRALLALVVLVDPKPSYDEVGATLDMPHGSIGPTRQRCLNKLRDILEGDPAL